MKTAKQLMAEFVMIGNNTVSRMDEELDTPGLQLYAGRKLLSSLSENTPLSLSNGTVTILKVIEPPISTVASLAPGAQAHAPALEATAKGKNVKRLKRNQGTVLAIRKPRPLFV
jgi:hypothetical protein